MTQKPHIHSSGRRLCWLATAVNAASAKIPAGRVVYAAISIAPPLPFTDAIAGLCAPYHSYGTLDSWYAIFRPSSGGDLLMIGGRDFIGGMGGATWPLAAQTQQPALPVVGFLSLGSPIATRSSGAGGRDTSYLAAFRQGLASANFVESRTVVIEYRWANNQLSRLAPLAAELVQRQVAVIVALDSGPTVLSAKAA